MSTFRRAAMVAALGVAVSAMSSGARATTLLPGGGSALVDLIAPTDPSLTGSLLFQETVPPFSVSDTGGYPDVTAKVIRRADTGTLDFYYLVDNGTPPNSGFTINGFAGVSTDVYQLEALAFPPNLPSVAEQMAGPGMRCIGTAISSVEEFFLVRTSATELPVVQELTFVQSSDIAGVPSRISVYRFEYAAAGAVPEPASCGLLALATLGLVIRTRSRVERSV